MAYLVPRVTRHDDFSAILLAMSPDDRKALTGILVGLAWGGLTMAGPLAFPDAPPWLWQASFGISAIVVIAGLGILAYDFFIRPRLKGQDDTRPRGAKLITLGQNIILGTIFLSIVGMVLGTGLIFIGDRQNAADYSAKVNAVVEAAKKFVELHADTPPAVTAEQERVFVPPELTPERLLSFYQDNTGIQAAELTKHYIGQWMQITGTLRNVGAFTGSYAQVSFEKNYTDQRTWFDYADILCYFRKPWVDRLQTLRRGDKIKMICQIGRIGQLDLELLNWELVDSDPPAKVPKSE
jgi:tRNA_anti-like